MSNCTLMYTCGLANYSATSVNHCFWLLKISNMKSKKCWKIRTFYSPTVCSGSLSRLGKAVFLLSCCWLFNSLRRSPDKPFPIILMVHWALKEAENAYAPSPAPVFHYFDPFHPSSFLSPPTHLIHKTTGCGSALPGKLVCRNGFHRVWNLYDAVCFF